MSYRLHFTLEGLPKILSNGSQGSWRKSHGEKMKWQRKIRDFVILNKMRPDEPLKKAKVTITRHSFKCPDFDNMAIAAKPLMDGLVKVGVLIDDSMDVVTHQYKWERAPQLKGFVELVVEEL